MDTRWEKFSRTFLSKKSLTQKAIYGFEIARSLTFLGQNLLLVFINDQSRVQDPKFSQNLKMILKDLSQLLDQDAENIAAGLYPISVLKPEGWQKNLKRYPQIIFDAISVKRRRMSKKSHEFNQESEQYMRDVPDYFRRNFHFQTGGYLTDQSAKLYEHQVEILFTGAADAMRRLLLPPLKKHFPNSQGEGLHFLEIAGGTGRLSRFVKLTFPKARMTILDLSHPYLKKAQENLSEFSRMDYVQGDSAELPFKGQQFDAVYSCFLFHELPYEERKKTLKEAARVLKAGGFCGLVDSLQNEDRNEFDWALQQFPVDFHEPFYKNYLQNPMEGLFQEAGFTDVERKVGFFSKAVSARKSS